MLMNNYHTLVRTVLVEKAPFKVLMKDNDNSIPYDLQDVEDRWCILVRNCVSLKEILNGLTKGMDWENKKIYTQKYLKSNLSPTDFYVVVKGLRKMDTGKVMRKSFCIKSTLINKCK